MELISPEYKELNIKLHQQNKGFGGGGGKKRAEYIIPVMRKYKVCTLLDYGCGKCKQSAFLQIENQALIVSEYDPCIPGKDDLPIGKFDMVSCCDVMEHVEEDYVNNVLKHIYNLTDKVVFFLIGLKKANKTLEDGRNTHITLLSPFEWEIKIENYFLIKDSYFIGDNKYLVFICEPDWYYKGLEK